MTPNLVVRPKQPSYANPEQAQAKGNTFDRGKLDAQRQYVVIGTLALLLIFLCDLLCKQGSSPGGDRRGIPIL